MSARYALGAHRHDPPDGLDYFPTPPWATRALIEQLELLGHDLNAMTAWDPACGENHMVRPLAEAFGKAVGTDIHDYGVGAQTADFLFPVPVLPVGGADFIVTNPPFNRAEDFIHRARQIARVGVAMLVRAAFAEGVGRYRTLFSVTPPDYEFVFSERVLMLKGRLVRTGAPDPASVPPGRKASTATAYVWMLWLAADASGATGGDPRKRWIAPCRQRFERPGDYPNYSHNGE